MILAQGPLKYINILIFIMNLLKENPFLAAYREAVAVGQLLAHLVSNGLLFPNCCISLIGFSLGTLVIQSCLEELNRYGKENMFYEVVMLGGVADKQAIQKLGKIKSIGGRLINCYSQNDYVLKYLFKLLKTKIKPVGLGALEDNGRVLNLNLCKLVKGHLQYQKIFDDILEKVDFNKDFHDLQTKTK